MDEKRSVGIFYLFLLPLLGLASPLRAQETMALSLEECIHLVLENNLDLKVEEYTPHSQEMDILAAKGEFDPGLSFTGSYLKARTKTFTVDNTTGDQATVIGDFLNFQLDLSVGQRLLTGTGYQVTFSNSLEDSSVAPLDPIVLTDESGDPILDPETGEPYKIVSFDQPRRISSSLTFQLTQSLLKGFGRRVNRTRITLAEYGHETSKDALEIRVSDIILQVEEAYWNLVLARGTLEVQERSLELARELQRNIEAQVKVGLQAPIEVLVAKAEVATRESQRIAAEQALRDAEDVLKKLLNLHDGTIGEERLTATDEPFPSGVLPPPPKLDESLEDALSSRPELHQSILARKTQQVSLENARNATLPDLQLQASLTLSGLSVEVLESNVTIEPPLDLGNEGTGKGASYLDTFDDYNDNYRYSIGITMNYPLGNRAARGSARKASVELEKAKLLERNVKQGIILEVRQANRAVETSLKQIEASRLARDLAQQKLDAERKKLEVGSSTYYNVLQFQKDLAEAELNHLKALIDYRISLARLAKARGKLLAEHEIDIETE